MKGVAQPMISAAAAFIAALGPEQRALAQWPFPSDRERRRWYYTPTDHGGVPLGDLRPRQQQLAMRLLSTGLSRPGYVTAATVMALENVLDEVEQWTRDWGRERGRDPGLYYVRVFGDPSAEGTWSWRFGGHHLSIHHLVVDGDVAASSPCFMGADPASAPLLGPHPLRPLEGIEELARALVQSLDTDLRREAVISEVPPPDMVTGNRPRVKVGQAPPAVADVWRGRFQGRLAALVAEVDRSAAERLGYGPGHRDAVRLTAAAKGVRAGAMPPAGRNRLRSLLDLYTGRLPDAIAQRERARYAGENINDVRVAWAGGLRRGEPHYYRLQGPQFLVEYDNTSAGANHIHSVWRVPSGDFGDDVLRAHIAKHHANSR